MYNRTKAILIAAAAAVIVIVLIVVAIIQNGKGKPMNDARSEASSETTVSAAENTSFEADKGNASSEVEQSDNIGDFNITGTWYSDRSDEDEITFSENGTYISSAWLAPGKYTVEGDQIILTDKFGTMKKLAIKTQDGETTLFSDNQSYSHTYYSTREMALSGSESGQVADGKIREDYKMVIGQILPGSWISSDQSTEAVFKDQGFVIKNIGESAASKEERFSYTITGIEFKDNSHFVVTMDVKNLGNGSTFTLKSLKIYENQIGSYSFDSPTFPYRDTFDKAGPVAISGSLTDPDRAKGEVTEVPLFDAEELKAVEKGVVGTWKGSVDPLRDGNVLNQTYVFKADKTYSISYDGFSESGTYTVTHDEKNALYPHTFILKSGEMMTKKIFKIDSGYQTITFEDMKSPELKKQ